MSSPHSITAWHAHVYFDATSIDQARALCDAAEAQFSLNRGRTHEKNVGPHPMWSCQLAFHQRDFAGIVPWLAQHRDGLTIFIHGCTGDDYVDHTAHTIWMGSMPTLDLSIFRSG